MVDPKVRVIEYYRANVDEEIDKITKELKEKKKELDEIIEALTLSAVKLTGLPSGTGISKPVEQIQQQQDRIIKIYKKRLDEIEADLTHLFNKKKDYEDWLESANLSDTEINAIKYKYKNGYADWKVAEKIPCNTRTVWKILSRAFNKLKKISK